MQTRIVAARPASQDSLRELKASAEVLDSRLPEAMTAWHRKYASQHLYRLAVDLDMIKADIPPTASILECGSIPLILTLAIHSQNRSITGCDIEPDRYAQIIAENNLTVLKVHLEQDRLPFPDGQFDCVLFNELFEHLRINPVFALSEVLRVLKPGGKLLLSTPNLWSLKGLFNFLFRKKAYSCSADPFTEFSKLSTIGHMGHVREYTYAETEKFLGDVGLQVEKLIFRGGYKNPLANWATRLVPKLRPFVTVVASRPDQIARY